MRQAETLASGLTSAIRNDLEGILQYLVFTSLIWAFSFGLIKHNLTGYDPLAISLARLSISALVFTPFLHPRRVGRRLILHGIGLGAVQFGIMYWLYVESFEHLPAYGVALFTIFTPFYVILLENILSGRWVWRHATATLLAVLGAAFIVARSFSLDEALAGILLLQSSNLCFAIGQVGARRLLRRGGAPVSELSLIAWMYVGAALFVAVSGAVLIDMDRVSFDGDAMRILLYLGVVPTGIGFYLWNKGAARVGAGTLAAANNLKVPLAIVASWLVFGERADYLRVTIGLLLITVGLIVAAWKEDSEFQRGRLGPRRTSDRRQS
ncbi:MAG: hypothetical protein A2289_22995 [Deltaproteobacteria bacterium RIFOXYA12_FULL_58_15]|nr:MAG: hypothetical protein A2289_22995 [Deltaproteobacteria bacterium RIFOXYA12_FULL_58_15]OGR08870.1 MAG: hypothetical protein A2341_27730 [Deltaproteobacteria bacterium RIFOXYB12_FULL_58_9]